MHFVTVHARHVKALCRARSVEQGVITRTLGAKAEIIADQDIFRAQSLDQYLVDERLWGQRRQLRIKRQDHRLLDATLGQISELVAQRADARGGQLWLMRQRREIVARMRLER